MDRESSSAGLSAYEIPLTGRGAISCWRLGGTGERRGVGILHGLGDHAGRYAELGSALLERGFAVEAIDLPGHGKSYGKRGHVGSWLDYRAAVTAWMDRAHAAAPDRTWTLLGQSMGAFIALDWALAHPARVERLVLCAPPFQLGFRPSLLKVKAAQALVRFWPGFSQGNMILPSMLSHDQSIVRAHMEDPLVHYRITARLFLEFQFMRASLMKRVGELKTPTLVIQGGEDHVADPAGSEKWVKMAPEGLVELRLYPGLYHEVLAEVGRTEIIASLIDWLEKPMASRGGPGAPAVGASTPPRASRS
ncbi:MAG TPA: alpha/beta hydrolase [Candidatus Eisenbacteria bacterium]|nr:alpha/beta hydrolase [Candidatus Eisenbacteria bacterium]